MDNPGPRLRRLRAGPIARVRAATSSILASAVLLLAFGCGREATAVGSATGVAKLVVPAFQSTDGDDDEIDGVTFRVYVVNPAGSATRRREIRSHSFNPNTDPRFKEDATEATEGSITLEFPLQGEGSVYEIEGGAFKGGTLLYEIPTVSFTQQQVTAAGGATVSTTPVYVGPGAGATRIVVSPSTLTLKPGETGTLTAQVFNAANATVSGATIRWRSSNPNIVSINDDRVGTVRANQQAGSATITAEFEAVGIFGSATVTVTLTPTALTVVGGTGQSGVAGQQLATPIRVRLVSGTAPVPGASVNFNASAGGSATPPSAVTNALGEAETRWTLGSGPGTQTLTASASGVSNATVTATATAPPVTVSIISTNPSTITTTTSSQITAELRTSGTPTAGQIVNFSASAGGSLSPDFAMTNSSGQVSSIFTAASPGSYTVTASAQGATAQTTITVVSGTTVTALQKVSGDAQTVQQGQTFGQPIVVRAVNGAGGPVAGANIAFPTSNPNSPLIVQTNSSGQASVTYTAPFGATGSGTIVVHLQGNSAINVTFTYTATP